MAGLLHAGPAGSHCSPASRNPLPQGTHVPSVCGPVILNDLRTLFRARPSPKRTLYESPPTMLRSAHAPVPVSGGTRTTLPGTPTITTFTWKVPRNSFSLARFTGPLVPVGSSYSKPPPLALQRAAGRSKTCALGFAPYTD